MSIIYPNQIKAFGEIIADIDKESYFLLVAQMQSGKTDTFLLCAFEFIRLNIVKTVTIFTGNSDLVLKNQTINGIRQFRDKYKHYLLHHCNYNNDDMDSMFDLFAENISVVWSTELWKQERQEDTLYIWEESHYAQSSGMIPSKFIKTIDLNASGGMLDKNRRNYVISVSATPFSELANIVLHKQSKKIVFLESGDGYKGVSYFLKNKIVLSHPEKFEQCLIDAKIRIPNRPIYGIVRVNPRTDEINIYRSITRQFGWELKTYFLENKEIDIRLIEAPLNDTIILIKGALRMGQQVSKEHVGFVYEFCETSKTDTILQGLLGRMCSFGNQIENIRIYLHENILLSNELEKYVEMIDCLSNKKQITQIPTKGANIKSVPLFLKNCNPPIYISAEFICDESGKKQLKQTIVQLLKEQLHEFAETLENMGLTQIVIRQLNSANDIHHLTKIVNATRQHFPFHSTKRNVTTFWVISATFELFPELQLGDVFIEYKQNKNMQIDEELNVLTNGEEIFCG